MIFGTALGSKIFNIEKFCNEEFGEEKARQLIKKTGPKKLFICGKNENTLSLSIKAWYDLKKKITPNLHDVENIVYITENPIRKFPGNGFYFASKIKIKNTINIIDINSGCTGFVDALGLALELKKESIIICSETYSKNISKFTRSISTLFSDGAAAFVLNHNNIELIKKSYGFLENTSNDLSCEYNQDMSMNGKVVYDFTMTSVIPNLISFIKKSKRKIDRMYFHQGSRIVIKNFKTKLSKYCKHIPENISLKGNLVSATIPHLINDDLIKRPLKNEEIILLCGFGVGLAYSIILLKVKGKK